MICPHCNVGVRLELESEEWAYPDTSNEEVGKGYTVVWSHCSECNRFIVIMQRGMYRAHDSLSGFGTLAEVEEEEILYPKSSGRPVPNEVPEDYKNDFIEACLVFSLSPKASAALSRRLLQKVLRERFNIKKRSLSQEIDEFIQQKNTPSYLGQAVDAVRNVGNFAAHPMKDTNTSEIVDVEPGEAEWLLEVLDSLFDYAFVQPEKLKQRQQELNSKLQAIGKPPMKTA